MNTCRLITVPLIAAALFFCLSATASRLLVVSRAQQSVTPPSSEVQRGIDQYHQGKTEEAVKTLRAVVKKSGDDADAWHYLGLALTRDGDIKGARKAFETAVKIRPDFVAAHTGFAYVLLLNRKSDDARRAAERALSLNERNAEAHYIIGATLLQQDDPAGTLSRAQAALDIKPDFAPAYLLKSQALIAAHGKDTARSVKTVNAAPEQLDAETRAARRATTRRRFAEAAESLARFVELTPNAADKQFWSEQLKTLRVYAKPAVEGEPESVTSDAASSAAFSITKAQILKRPAPGYTEHARRAGVEGDVTLRLVLSSDGTIKNILVTRALSHGLTEKAVAAARKIKFIPAMKDGRPVSQYISINYNFSIY